MTPSWIHTLEKLRTAGSIAGSEIPRGIRKDLEEWGERTGCLRLVREGRGVVLRVVSSEILQSALRRLGSDEDHSAAPQRAQNLARYRDTKVGATRHEVVYFLLKAVGEGILVATEGGGGAVSLSDLSRTLGCAALALGATKSPGWICPEPIILVENQAVFDDLSWLPEGWRGVVLYYGGELSTKLISWLARSQFQRVTLFPDYDGVGLQNFARLRESLPHCRWYWHPGWEGALERFGNPALWGRGEQRKIVDELWARWEAEGWPDPRHRVLIATMRRLGVMLEQEWVQLKAVCKSRAMKCH